MGGDEILDDARKSHLFCHLQTLGYVADDDLGTLQVAQLVVWIHARLVLREEHWVGHLSDVVIECARTYQQTVGTDAVGNLCCQVTHRDGMLEGARCNLAQVAEQSLVGIRQLEEGDIRGESECLLDDIHERIGQQQEDAVHGEIGVRGIYASTNYYGYVEDIKVGNMPLYKVLDPTKETAANIELSCDQSGVGFTPIIGVDFKTGKWNFAAKYEFKTRIRLKNKSVNQVPSIGNLPDNLRNAYIAGGVPEQAADAILNNATIQGAMGQLKTQFDTKLDKAIGEYADGKKIAGDIPAYLALGVGYSPVNAVRVNVGFHWFDDKHATSYNNRQEKLDRGTLEYNAGVEVDVNKKITLSTGWQNTNYGLSDEYMDDKSFVVGSNSAAVGGVYHINKKMDLNVAYFHTFYQHKKTSENVQLSADKSINYTSDYTRNNNVFAVGLDINF